MAAALTDKILLSQMQYYCISLLALFCDFLIINHCLNYMFCWTCICRLWLDQCCLILTRARRNKLQNLKQNTKIFIPGTTFKMSLQNGSHFPSASMCYIVFLFSPLQKFRGLVPLVPCHVFKLSIARRVSAVVSAACLPRCCASCPGSASTLRHTRPCVTPWHRSRARCPPYLACWWLAGWRECSPGSSISPSTSSNPDCRSITPPTRSTGDS